MIESMTTMGIEKKEKHIQKNTSWAKRAKRFLKKTAALLWTIVLSASMNLTPVLANDGVQAITEKFNIAREIIAALITSIGVMVVLWGIFQLGSSMQSQEGSLRTQALERIGGGLVMTLAPQLVVVLV